MSLSPLSNAVGSVRMLPLAQLVRACGSWLPMAEPLNQTQRPFTRWNTFWLFLGQVLNPQAPCREAVCAAQAHLADPRATPRGLLVLRLTVRRARAWRFDRCGRPLPN